MPTYDYRCRSCSFEFEELQRISDDQLVTCPQCGKDTLMRVIAGGAGLVFKGSGFYLTDYKAKKTSESDPPAASKKSEPKKDSPSSPDSSKPPTPST
jgi:putative FmdB family regulatory protein